PTEKIPFRIHLLRAANPLALKLLGSRLHFLMSRDLLVANFRGRKSGKPFSTPLSYVEVDGNLYLCTRPEGANWWKNMREGVPIEIVWRGEPLPACATVLDTSSEEALAGFRAFLARYPGTATLLYHVNVAKDGTPNEEDVLREVRQSVVVRVEPGPSPRTRRRG
ncbi:MAG: nitroreductase family deazaflavin-dependent oxidoreductase, partial [bacterium]|nr:nitroreductase family deazaflavin-dependent oxidoreductase [bacterium]